MRKHGNKALSLLLALVIVLAMLPTAALAVTSGTCGDNVTWTLNNGVLTISGTGAIENFKGYDGAPWYGRREEITSVVIGNGITEIGEFAFEETALTGVVIPDGVTRIGSAAFQGCTKLTSVTIPQSVELIDEAAFRETPWIKAQGGLVVVNGTLLHCEWVDNVYEVTLPRSVTKIGPRAFIMRAELTAVNIPNGVTSIGEEAFMGCYGLTGVTIPASVTEIGQGAFEDCTGLTGIQVEAGNQNYTAVDGVLFTKDRGTLHTYPGGKQGAYTIPDGVTSIGGNAFFYCTGLTRVTIPGSVISIGELAFYDCAGLTDVTIQGGVSSIGLCAFMYSGLTRITIPSSVSSIGAAAFDRCDKLKDVSFVGTEAQWKAIAIGLRNDPLLSAAIHFEQAPSSSGPILNSNVFVDVPADSWHHDAVYWAVSKDITSGTGTNPPAFTPNQTCTETEILTFLWRAAGEPASTVLPFMPKDTWAAGALRWAYAKGMIGASFNQTAPCTRASAAKFIWQAAGSPATAVANSFTDVPAGAGYAQAVAWAVSKGITNGTSATTFSPDKTCTRAEIVTFLYRAYK